MLMKRNTLVTCAAIICLGIAGCATVPNENDDWQHTQVQNPDTLSSYDYEQAMNSYQVFIDKYPKSVHVPEAQKFIATAKAEIAWGQLFDPRPSHKDAYSLDAFNREAGLDRAVNGFRDFVATFPNSPHVADAHRAMDEISWMKASPYSNQRWYQDYLTSFPDGEHATDARTALGEIAEAEKHPIMSIQVSVSKSEYFLSGRVHDEGNGMQYDTVLRSADKGTNFVIFEITPAPRASCEASLNGVYLTSPKGDRVAGMWHALFFSSNVWDPGIFQGTSNALDSAHRGPKPAFLFVLPQGTDVKSYKLNLGEVQVDLDKLVAD